MQEWIQLFRTPILCLLKAKATYSFLYTSIFTESQGSMKVYGIKTQLPKTVSCEEQALKEKLGPQDFDSKL